MHKEKWERIQTLFEQAVELDKNERDRFLQKECAGQPELLAEVQSLLDEDENLHPALSESAGLKLKSMVSKAESDRMIGKILGEYRVESVIASGGMGTVYNALRADGAFEQQVALKISHHSLSSASFEERFRQERQILARLNHPHIARLLDGGVTDDGLPFFVMEYVSGQPIDQYVQDNNLSIDQILDLFLVVCKTVGYAHSQLIVHRDLKPGNIFVTETGQVKLLDFGIAKVFDSDSASPSAQTLTQGGQTPFTPEYAAPEQIMGQPVSTSTDVYAMGVILYELLTGQRPYSFDSSQIAEIQSVVTNAIPQKPSTIVLKNQNGKSLFSDIKLTSRRLRGDLDSICLKALKKEEQSRYATIEQMADDIQRHLSGLPVGASGDFLLYRFRKFTQRHKVGISTFSLFSITIFSLIYFYTAQLRQQTLEAQLEAKKAAAVSEFLGGLFEAAGPEEARGKEVTAEELLAKGAKRIDTELFDQPEVQATMFSVVGDVYRRIAEFEKAEQLFLKSLERAQTLYSAQSNEVIDVYQNLGNLYREMGQMERSGSYYSKALELASVNENTDDILFAEILHGKAILDYEQGSYLKADSLYAISLSIYQNFYGDEHSAIASLLNARASVARKLERFEESEQLYKQALNMRRKLFGDDHPDVAHTLNHLSRLMYFQGRYREAESYAREGLALRLKIFGEINPETAASASSLAGISKASGELSEALKYYRQVEYIVDQVYQDSHPYKPAIKGNIGSTLFELNRYSEAEEFLTESRRLMQEILPKDHIKQSGPALALGNLYIELGRLNEALPLLKESYELRSKRLPSDHQQIIEVINALGNCYLELKNYDLAESNLVESYQVLKKTKNAEDKNLRRVTNKLVRLYQETDQAELVEFYLKELN